jgi:alpha-ribazole phosphatase
MDLAQVPDIAARLAGVRALLWSSPAQRCRVVVDAIGPYRVDDRLQELDFGTWEGLPWDDVPRAALDAWAAAPAMFAPPGGESGAALIARVTSFYRDLGPGSHIVVTHGGPLKVLGALARRRPVDLLAPAPSLGSVEFIG